MKPLSFVDIESNDEFLPTVDRCVNDDENVTQPINAVLTLKWVQIVQTSCSNNPPPPPFR